MLIGYFAWLVVVHFFSQCIMGCIDCREFWLNIGKCLQNGASTTESPIEGVGVVSGRALDFCSLASEEALWHLNLSGHASKMGTNRNKVAMKGVKFVFWYLHVFPQISMSVQRAWSSATTTPAVSTCPAGTTASAEVVSMTMAPTCWMEAPVLVRTRWAASTVCSFAAWAEWHLL